MTESTFYSKNQLTIEMKEKGSDLVLHWKGKSNDRNPGQFVNPIMTLAMDKANDSSKRIVIDFVDMEFMNSSTISPLVKALNLAKQREDQIKVVYNKTLKWQELSFSALKVFETPDERICIVGA